MKDYIIDATAALALVIVLSGMMGLVALFVIQDHKVRCYYMTTTLSPGQAGYNVVGDVDWMEDQVFFSSPDPKQAFGVYMASKQCAPKQSRPVRKSPVKNPAKLVSNYIGNKVFTF